MIASMPQSVHTNGASAENLPVVSNPFRDRVTNGQVTSVVSVKLVTTNEMPMMVKMAGHKAVFIDMEHSPLDFSTVNQLCLACNYVGVSPVVRAPSKSHWHISRILDGGAAAVVIPHIESVQEVRDVVSAGKYAPIGNRGSTNNQAILNFQHFPARLLTPALNSGTMIIPMIETIPSLDIVDEILAIDGVDGLLIGSNDLSAELGIPGQYDHPLLVDNIVKVIEAGNRAGKSIGIGGQGPRKDLLEKYFEMGASWSLSGADHSIMQAGLKKLGQKYDEMDRRVQEKRQSKK